MKVIFDTNAYRGLAIGRNPGEVIEVFRQIRATETRQGISAFVSPVVWLELFSHLADQSDPHLQDCLGGVVGSYLHSRVNETTWQFRIAHRAEILVATTLFGFNDPEENQLLASFDRMAELIFGQPVPDVLVQYEVYLKELKQFSDNEEAGFMDRFNQLQLKFLAKYRGEVDLAKKIQTDEFFNSVALWGMLRAAINAGIDPQKMTDVELKMGTNLMKDYFPAPLRLVIDIMTRFVTNEEFDISKRSRRNWYWDYQILFYISKSHDTLLVTDDEDMIRAAKAAGIGDKIKPLKDYLNLLGLAIELKFADIVSRVVSFKVPDGQQINLEDVARQLGVAVESFPPGLTDELKNAPAIIKKDKDAVRKIIAPFYEEAEKNAATNGNKHLELIDLGKFIHRNTLDLRLLEVGESPDFVIEYQGERVGLELSRLFNKDEQHAVGKTASLLEEAKKYVLKQAPDVKGLYNISLSTDRITMNGRSFIKLLKIELKTFAETLGNYIISIHRKTTTDVPDFIDNVIVYKTDTLNFEIHEDFIRRQLEISTLVERIREKDLKIEAYKANKKLSSCWLLLIYTSSISSMSFHVDPAKLPTNRVLFDRIFLMDSLEGQISEGNVIR